MQLRLYSPKGRPNLKLVATEDGSVLVLGGEPGWLEVLWRSDSRFLKLHRNDGRERLIKP